MIFDKLENASLYYNLNDTEGIFAEFAKEKSSSLAQKFKIAFDYLKNADLKTKECAKYVINEDIFISLQEYETKSDAPFELHRKYIDIQLVLKGEENMGFANRAFFIPEGEYDAQNDVTFGKAENKNGTMRVCEGFFTIFTPEDAHAPSLLVDKKEKVKKAIVKIRI